MTKKLILLATLLAAVDVQAFAQEESKAPKLLRVLEDGEFQRLGSERTIRTSVRVISATNRNLQTLVARDKFREDLYYRLSVVPIRVPSLRERPEDIRDLALKQFCSRNNIRSRTIDEAVFPALERYGWPGNLRELRNAIERMAILVSQDEIGTESLPVEIRNPADNPVSALNEIRNQAERDRILRALDETDWNVSGAARALGIERTNLHKRIRALGLSRQDKV